MTNDELYRRAEDRLSDIAGLLRTVSQFDSFQRYIMEAVYDYGLWCFELGKNNAEQRPPRITQTIS